MRGLLGLFSHKIPLRLIPVCIQDSRLMQLRLSLTDTLHHAPTSLVSITGLWLRFVHPVSPQIRESRQICANTPSYGLLYTASHSPLCTAHTVQRVSA